MRLIIIILLFCCVGEKALAQQAEISLNENWYFAQADKVNGKWYKATVPGTIHTDLLKQHLVADPFYRDNEKKVQWVETKEWIYKKTFQILKAQLQQKDLALQFDGLDTYAQVFLNGKLVILSDNMFRQWTIPVQHFLMQGTNELKVRFQPAATMAKAAKANEIIPHPDNERIYVRKAQYQFGWDWGPRLVTCGIWKDVRLIRLSQQAPETYPIKKNIKLVTEKDSAGERFYFAVDGKPVYIKGANWIPVDNFLPAAKKRQRYETLLSAAKEAHVNMLRVWGGGVYEDDIFYELCDQYGIWVWQDFMFAGALYPSDSAFLESVEKEVRYQVKRLRKHPCLALWCGNNEIEEAWFNWGWQQQFHYAPTDSAKLWNNYLHLFHELIPSIIKELDPQTSYWPSSPSLGWGRDSAYKKGDVHFWGVWWGKEPVAHYRQKVGRFNSEYGMQGMPDMKTIRQFALPSDMDTSSPVMRTHQKHPFGYENIKEYINQKFKAPANFEQLVYVSQLMQADALKVAIEAHRSGKPYNMGTLFWQWNDCWPVTSWSAVDYYGRKKAAYYEVKRSFAPVVIIPQLIDDDVVISMVTDDDTLHQLNLVVRPFDNDSMGPPISLGNKNFTLFPGVNPKFSVAKIMMDNKLPQLYFQLFQNDSLIAENILLPNFPKDLSLKKNYIHYKVNAGSIELEASQFCYGVAIEVPDGVRLSDNYFHLLPGQKKRITFTSTLPVQTIARNIKIHSLADAY